MKYKFNVDASPGDILLYDMENRYLGYITPKTAKGITTWHCRGNTGNVIGQHMSKDRAIYSVLTTSPRLGATADDSKARAFVDAWASEVNLNQVHHGKDETT